MGGIGNLSELFDDSDNKENFHYVDFFEDESGLNKKAKQIWDGSWLEVDPAEYNMAQRLPDYEKTLNAKPQLESLWDHKSKIHYYNSKDYLHFTQDMADKADLKTEGKTKESNLQKLSTLTKIAQDVRKNLTLGKDAEAVYDYLSKKYDSSVVKEASKTIDVIFENEYGLLGNVYVDPSVFVEENTLPPRSCEDGAKTLKGKAKTASYIKAMPSCKDCYFNKQGSCTKFNRKVVSNLNYDASLIEKLSKDLQSLGKVTSKQAAEIKSSNNPMLAIRQAFTFKKKKEREVGGVQAYPELKKLSKREIEREIQNLEKTAQDAKFLKAAKSLQAKVKPIWNFIGKSIQQGYSGQSLNKRVASKYGIEDLKKYASNLQPLTEEQGLLGKLYVSTEYWDWNCKKAHSEISHSDSRSAPFIQQTPNCESCVFKSANQCGLFDKTITPSKDNINLDAVTPVLLENLHQGNRLTASEKQYYNNQKPSFDLIRKAFTHKKKQIRVGGVKAEAMPTRMPKKAVLFPKTPVSDFLRKEMHRGNGKDLILSNAKSKFASQEISREDNLIRSTLNELGLLGNVYIDPDVYNDCKVGAKEFNPKGKQAFVKAASKCSDCVFNKQGSCGIYQKPILGQFDGSNINPINWEKVAHLHIGQLLESNKITLKQANEFLSIPDKKYAVRLAYITPKEKEVRVGGEQYRTMVSESKQRDPQEVVSKVATTMLHHMNQGKHGEQIAQVLKSNFDKEALELSKETIGRLSSEDVVLGNVYVNPVYNGGNCYKQAEDLRGKPQVSYVQKNHMCGDCRFNKKGKYCSLIKRDLVDNVSYDSKLAHQHLSYLQNQGRLDTSFKISSGDVKQLIKNAYRYKKPKQVRFAGVQHIEQPYERKAKVNIDALTSQIREEMKKGTNVESIIKNASKVIPEFKVREIVSNLVQEITSQYKLKTLDPNKKSSVHFDYTNYVDEFEVEDDLNVDVDDTTSLLDMEDYL